MFFRIATSMSDTVEGAFELLGGRVRAYMFPTPECKHIPSLSPLCLKTLFSASDSDYDAKYERMLCMLHGNEFDRLASECSSLRCMLALHVCGVFTNGEKIRERLEYDTDGKDARNLATIREKVGLKVALEICALKNKPPQLAFMGCDPEAELEKFVGIHEHLIAEGEFDRLFGVLVKFNGVRNVRTLVCAGTAE